MKSYILECSKQMPLHTDMRRVFEAIKDRQTDYNWLITDIDHYEDVRRSAANESFDDSEFRDDLTYYSLDALDKDTVWIDGEELTKIINGNDIQFVWAVFSGFRKNINIDPEDLIVEPYADGNPNFWIEYPKIQHPLAEIEIVCWDSTSTLFFCIDEELGNMFKEHFLDSIDLATYNKKYL